MGLISSILGAFTSGINTKNTNKTNLAINRETNAANAALAQQQNAWNVEQWQRENAYNSPANQRQLLVDAGYNPNLYGGDGATANNLVSAPLANQQPTTVNPMPGGLFDFDLLEPLRLELEKKRLQNEINKSEADIEKTKAETKKVYQDTKQAMEIFPYLRDSEKFRSYSSRAQSTVDDASTQYRIAELYLDNKAKEAVIKMSREQISQIRHQCALIAAQTEGVNRDNAFKQLEMEFSRQFGMPLDSSAGKMVLDYICSNYKTQTEIKGDLSAGAMIGGVGLRAGAGATRHTQGFDAANFFRHAH